MKVYEFGKEHSIYLSDSYNQIIDISEAVNFPEFGKLFNYDGNDLGVTYTPNSTTFKVWAPTASIVRLMIYKSGIPESYTDEEI